MMSIEHVDILVLGLGPAGASAAAEAARRGVRVVAIDRKKEAGRPVQCAEFVPAMIGVDAGDFTGAVRQSISAMATFVEDGTPDVKERFPGHMLDREAFDAGIVARAKQAGAVCRLGLSARRISAQGAVELSDGSTIASRVLIGADGPCSLAGSAIGQVNEKLVETRQITVTLRRAHESTDIFLSADIPGGYGWLFPKREVANLGAGVDPPNRRRLKAIVARLHRRLSEAGRVGPEVLGLTGGLIPVGGMLKPYGRLGTTALFLAGDAAGLANPVTGAGIAAALQSGRLAGEAAAEAISGNAEAGEEYEEELNNLFGAALARALERRNELATASRAGAVPPAALRRGWIAYPEYWAA